MTYSDDAVADVGQALEKPWPNAAEAERAILGAILLDQVLIFQAAELLRPEDFYVPSHRKIFMAMLKLFEHGAEINPILIGEELKKEKQLEAVGGISFITNLTHGLPYSINIEYYAKIVVDKARLREYIRIQEANVAEAFDEEDDVDAILARGEQRIFGLTTERYKGALTVIDEILDEVIEDGHQNIGLGLTADGLDTGFIEINQLTAGFQRSDLIIIGANPGMGKTSFAQCLINNVSIRQQKVCAFFSLEMRKKAVAARGLCSEARVDHQRYRNGFLNHEEWESMMAARQLLRVAPIYLDDTPGSTVLEVRAKSLRLQSELARLQSELALIVVDFLQLMTGTKERRRESRQQEVAGIARDLKTLAKEMNVPLVALSQLSRANQSRQDKRPLMSDLRESGEIEQVADVVAFLYREAQYTPNLSEENKRLAEFIIAKQRNGPSGVTAMLRFEGRSFRFDNLQQHSF